MEIESPEFRSQFSALLDQAFSVPPGRRFLEDFPVWDPAIFPAPGRVRRIGIFRESRLVSSAAVRLADFRGEARLALIGAVATAPSFRGRGLAAEAVSLALEWAVSQSAQAALLWGSEHRFYHRLGFELVGEQIQLPLEGLALSGKSAVRLRVLQGWSDSIFGLMRRREPGLELGDGDLDWIRAHRSVQWFWAEADGRPTAYVALGRGIDLAHIVHEWGGETESLHALLACIRTQDRQAILLGSRAILKKHGFLCGNILAEKLALGKKLDGSWDAGTFWERLWIWGLDGC